MLGGVFFHIPDGLNCAVLADKGDFKTYPTSYLLPLPAMSGLKLHILQGGLYELLEFAGQTLGRLTITYTDASTKTVDLVIGSNVRDLVNASVNVYTTTDPAVQKVWQGDYVGTHNGWIQGSCVIDMQTIELDRTKTLQSLALEDLHATSGFVLEGVTIEGPNPPEVYHPESVTLVKGRYKSGDAASLAAEDGNYYHTNAVYDPSDPLAFLNSQISCDATAASNDYYAGHLKVVTKTSITSTKFRVRAYQFDSGLWHIVANDVPGSLTNLTIEGDLPLPIGNFIDDAARTIRAEVRNSTPNRTAGFFFHWTDLVEWTLTP
jgi:hypothetical protein